jgi:hypothetical protein
MYIKYSVICSPSLAHVSEKNMRLMLERKMKKNAGAAPTEELRLKGKKMK